METEVKRGGDFLEQLTRVPLEIPFYNQYVSEETYAREGYAAAEEGLYWSCRSCGIASVRMVIDGIRAHRSLPACPLQGEMVRRGQELGGYKPGVGWIHQSLAALAAEYGVRGECRRGGTPGDVRREIEAGNPCIVSVSPRFAGGFLREDGTCVPRGGHLVVALGVWTENGMLTGFQVHHPSCFEGYWWPDCRVDAERFSASFSGNYLVFWP